jgi:hypothetical protein
MMMMKQMESTGSGEGEKKEGDGVDATSEYCAEAIKDQENRSSEQRQGGQERKGAQSDGDDLDA